MMDFAQPSFAEPHWLWLALCAAVLLPGLHRYAARARRNELARMASPEFVRDLTRSHSPGRRRLKEFLLVAIVLLMGLALARPRWGEWQTAAQPFAEDVVFVLDCSRSMLATDIQPDRLARAKSSILKFVRQHGQGRVGLVAFAGGAFLQCPLTLDYSAFEEALMSIDARTIPVGGTDIGRALLEANQAMDKDSDRKFVILLSDGEDLEKNGIPEAKSLAEEGVRVFTVGVGTPAGAEIRAAGPDGRVDYVRDEKGRVVRSRMDETTLRAIAGATGGDYQPLGRIGEGMTKLRLAVQKIGVSRVHGQGVDRFYFPLALALLLLVIESLLGTRRRKSAASQPQTPQPATVAALLLALGMFLGTTSPAAQATPPPVTARGFYNAGTQNLAAGKLNEAELMLQDALDQQNVSLQPVALYNLGHVRFMQGAEDLKKSPSEQNMQTSADAAIGATADAIRTAAAALTTDDVPQLVAAYRRGLGAQRELKSAFDQVRRALEAYGRTLEKWRRALADFQGSAELQLPGTNATHNAEVVERAIARLVDSEIKKQLTAMAMANQGSKLSELMGKLKGKIPKDQLASCTSGMEGGEEPDIFGFKEINVPREVGMKEGSDIELNLSPEQVGRLLDNLSPANRRLSMSADKPGKPKDPKQRDW